MNPNKHYLLAGVAMTPNERRLGRYLRDETGHTGPAPAAPAANPTGDGNNGTGNSPQNGNQAPNQNNTGADEINPVDFWSDPEPEPAPTPARLEPPQAPTQGPPANQPQDEFSQQLVQRIDNLDFGNVFTDEATAAINQGDFKTANEAITSNLRKAVKESMITNVQLMRRFGQSLQESILSEVKSQINSRFTGQQNQNELVKAIPSAADPKVGPGINAIYEHALKRTKNDIPKAIAMTKSMLRTLASGTAEDVGLDVAPTDPHSRPRQNRSVNWEEELLGLGGGN